MSTNTDKTRQEELRDIRKKYPISTFGGTTQDELVEFIEAYVIQRSREAEIAALGELKDAIWQGPPYTDHNCTDENCDECKATKVTRHVNAMWRMHIGRYYWELRHKFEDQQPELTKKRDTTVERKEGVFYDEKTAEKFGECCDKCFDVTFDKTWPEHTPYYACINLKCECHTKKREEN